MTHQATLTERFTAYSGDEVSIISGPDGRSPRHAMVYNHTRHATMCMSVVELYGPEADA